MRIFVISDTHLGFSRYRYTTEDNVNLRESDVYSAFDQFVTAVIEYLNKNERNRAVVIHNGDFFDNMRPSNRCLKFALQQLDRLVPYEGRVVVWINGGNHDTSRTLSEVSPLEILKMSSSVTGIAIEKTLRFQVEDTMCWLVPYSLSKSQFKLNLKQVIAEASELPGGGPSKDGYRKLLFIHAFPEGLVPAEDRSVDAAEISHLFDGIFFGHYHGHLEKEDYMVVGSSEAMSFAEAEMGTKVFLQFEDDQLDEIWKTPLVIRPLHILTANYSEMDAENLQSSTTSHFIQLIQNQEASDLKSLIKLKLLDFPPHQLVQNELIKQVLEEFPDDVIHVECQNVSTTHEGSADVRAEAQDVQSLGTLDLAQEIDDFIAASEYKYQNMNRVRDHLVRLIREAREEK